MLRSFPKHGFLLGYLVLVWGFAFALIAIALEALHPLFIVWTRLCMGAAVMWIVWRWRGQAWRLGREWWRRLLLLSLTGNIIPFSLIAWAEQTVPSAEVGILMALMPIATLLLAHWLLDDESLTVGRVVGVVVGFVGVGLLMGDELLRSGVEGQLAGQLAAIVATLSYAFNGVYAKRLPDADPVALSVGTLFVGALLLALPAVLFQGGDLGWSIPLKSWAAVFVLGIMGTGLATWSYFVVVSERGPGFLSTINYLIPAVAFLAGTLWLAEPWSVRHLLALILILLGVALIQWRRKG
ncbi:MAG: DMT family transporter [Luminiphilus sp.]|jgi:drug/metabolite transporter (DMT)-like permease